MCAVESLLWYDHVVIIYQSPALKYFKKHEKWAVHNTKEEQANLLTMWVISWNQSSSCNKSMFSRQQKQAKHKSLTHIYYLFCPDNHMGFGSQQRRPCLRRIIRACSNIHGKQWKDSHWHELQGTNIASGCNTTKVLKQDQQWAFYQRNILKPMISC